MTTVTVVNQKGGVCKTTLCRNLGYLLASKYGKRVLLIDLDSSGNLSSFFGFETTDDVVCGAAKIISNLDMDPHEGICDTRVQNLKIITGSEYLGRTERDVKSDNSSPQQKRLQYQLNKIKDEFDYCLVDCPPTVSDSILVYNSLVASDQVIIPCVPSKDSVQGVSKVQDMVEGVNRWFNDRLTIRGVVFFRIGHKTIDKDLVRQKLPVPRFRAYVRECGALAEYSLLQGKVFCEYQESSSGSKDMANLAAEFVGAKFPYPDELQEELDDYIS